jgi:predicted TIM-barrel fold metal-dependent hydrolase
MSLFMSAAPKGETTYGRVFPPDHAWLKLQQSEPILDPQRAIIDTHHHLWDLPNNHYFLEDFERDLKTGHNVVATVFAECTTHYRQDGPVELQSLGETEFAARLGQDSDNAHSSTRVAEGIVGFADLTLGDKAKPVLQAHIEAGQGRFRGVRHPAAWDASDVIGNSHLSTPHLLQRPDFRAGLAALESLGLSFDAWVFFSQLQDVIEVAQAFPSLNIILGHVGGPLGYGPYANKQEEVWAAWKASMTELAQYKNVSVKLGGQLMRLAAFDYQNSPRPPSSIELAKYWGPYMQTTIELFGADRCLFESNFPVEKMGTGYAVMWNAFKRITEGASEAEKDLLFSGTARRVYRLK